MPKVIRCKNRHYYDQELFQSCPHCDGGLAWLGKESTTEYHTKVSNYAMEYLKEQLADKKNDSLPENPVCSEELTIAEKRKDEKKMMKNAQ